MALTTESVSEMVFVWLGENGARTHTQKSTEFIPQQIITICYSNQMHAKQCHNFSFNGFLLW